MTILAVSPAPFQLGWLAAVCLSAQHPASPMQRLLGPRGTPQTCRTEGFGAQMLALACSKGIPKQNLIAYRSSIILYILNI